MILKSSASSIIMKLSTTFVVNSGRYLELSNDQYLIIDQPENISLNVSSWAESDKLYKSADSIFIELLVFLVWFLIKSL